MFVMNMIKETVIQIVLTMRILGSGRQDSS